MSSFYSDASLVMIPSGYKTSKVYSVKPTDGTGDLTFTRSNDTASRVASNGLIEKVRTNVLLYSQDYTQTAWTSLSTATLSSTTTLTPAGTTDAVRVTSTGATQDLRTVRAITNGETYTNSAYVRRVSGTGTVRILEVNGTTSVITPTSEWQRFSITSTATSTTGRLYIRLDESGDAIEVWGCQMEVSDFGPTDYIATTSAAVSVGPVANVPRLDYLGSSCPRLLLEPQRTNSLTYSEQFDNAVWTKTGVTITANTTATLDPSGYNGADKLVEDSSTGSHVVFASVTGTSGTFSFFAKAAERSWVSVLANNGNRVYFNLSNGTLGTIAAGSTASITSYGNGWYRCVVFNTHSTFGASVYLATGNDVGTYAGDGTSGAYVFGAQFEASATYASSYIPTLGAAVTRGVDRFTKTGISSLINSQEGTLFVEMAALNSAMGTTLLSLSDGTPNNNLYIGYTSTTNQISSVFASGGVAQAVLNSFAFNVTEQTKIAVSYKTNEVKMYVNGTLIGTDTSATMPAAGTLNEFSSDFGQLSFPLAANIKQAIIFPTALSNADLAALTA